MKKTKSELKIVIDLDTAIKLADEHNRIALIKLPSGADPSLANLKSAEDYLGMEYPLDQ